MLIELSSQMLSHARWFLAALVTSQDLVLLWETPASSIPGVSKGQGRGWGRSFLCFKAIKGKGKTGEAVPEEAGLGKKLIVRGGHCRGDVGPQGGSSTDTSQVIIPHVSPGANL